MRRVAALLITAALYLQSIVPAFASSGGADTAVCRLSKQLNSLSLQARGLRKPRAASMTTFVRAGADPVSPVLSEKVGLSTTAQYLPGISEVRSSASTYYHSGIKNTFAQTASNESVSASKRYDAFGNELATSGTWNGNYKYGGPFGYQKDSQSGLELLGNRYYDPELGRFLTRDVAKDGRNWYAYTNNQPITCGDPRGEQTIVFSGEKLKYFYPNGKPGPWIPAYSGLPGTKASDQYNKGGPIPEGKYWLYANDVQYASRNLITWLGKGYPPSSSWGKYRTNLNPAKWTKTHGRYGFFLHGGFTIGSAGCIDIGSNDEGWIGNWLANQKGKIKLLVDYSGWKGSVPSDANGRGIPW